MVKSFKVVHLQYESKAHHSTHSARKGSLRLVKMKPWILMVPRWGKNRTCSSGKDKLDDETITFLILLCIGKGSNGWQAQLVENGGDLGLLVARLDVSTLVACGTQNDAIRNRNFEILLLYL